MVTLAVPTNGGGMIIVPFVSETNDPPITKAASAFCAAANVEAMSNAATTRKRFIQSPIFPLVIQAFRDSERPRLLVTILAISLQKKRARSAFLNNRSPCALPRRGLPWDGMNASSESQHDSAAGQNVVVVESGFGEKAAVEGWDPGKKVAYLGAEAQHGQPGLKVEPAAELQRSFIFRCAGGIQRVVGPTAANAHPRRDGRDRGNFQP